MRGASHTPPRAAALLLLLAPALAAPPAQARPDSRIRGVFAQARAASAQASRPPSVARCLTLFGSRCYGVPQLMRAYDVGPLRSAGIVGRGRTIAIIDSFGSPTIRADLGIFDRSFGLPAPPSFRIYQPAGRVPRFKDTDRDMLGWAAESTLDVEWAHAFAPGAAIVLLETPVDETEGTHGMPQMMSAVRWAVRHHADVVSMSWGATEQTFPNHASILKLRSAFVTAAAAGAALVSATGDTGAAEPKRHNGGLYPFPATEWPASDPLVLATGGTTLTLDGAGNRLAPDVVWHDRDGAAGGGRSTVFARPRYQDPVAAIVGRHRGLPDISMSASDVNGADTYWSFGGGAPQWAVMGGTSLSTVEMAGLVADAEQLAANPLSNLPARLYSLSQSPAGGITDITGGDNSFGPFANPDGRVVSVRGFSARRGYDLASGLGTVDAARFVPALARAG